MINEALSEARYYKYKDSIKYIILFALYYRCIIYKKKVRIQKIHYYGDFNIKKYMKLVN